MLSKSLSKLVSEGFFGLYLTKTAPVKSDYGQIRFPIFVLKFMRNFHSFLFHISNRWKNNISLKLCFKEYDTKILMAQRIKLNLSPFYAEKKLINDIIKFNCFCTSFYIMRCKKNKIKFMILFYKLISGKVSKSKFWAKIAFLYGKNKISKILTFW